jgi:hypothetical protein
MVLNVVVKRLAPLFLIQEVDVQVLSWRPAILIKVFQFSPDPVANARIVP